MEQNFIHMYILSLGIRLYMDMDMDMRKHLVHLRSLGRRGALWHAHACVAPRRLCGWLVRVVHVQLRQLRRLALLDAERTNAVVQLALNRDCGLPPSPFLAETPHHLRPHHLCHF